MVYFLNLTRFISETTKDKTIIYVKTINERTISLIVPNTKTIPIVFEKYKLNSATSTADNIPPINIAKIPSIITSNICIKKSFL